MEEASHFYNAHCKSYSGNSPDRIRQTLDQFKQDLIQLLGDNLFEIIIHGSFVLNDFQPGKGDLDYMVITNENLDDLVNSRLFELHDKYRTEKHLFLHQLEGTFYPKHFLKKLSSPFTGCYIGTGRTGWRTTSSFQNSFMDLRLINEHGMYLLGKNPKIYNPLNFEILEEQLSDLETFITSAKTVRNVGIGIWITIVHWCSRTILYSSTGRIGSKTEACRWCAKRPELEPFRDVFKNAECRRYPYGEEVVSSLARTAYMALLEFMENFLLPIDGKLDSDKQRSSRVIDKG